MGIPTRFRLFKRVTPQGDEEQEAFLSREGDLLSKVVYLPAWLKWCFAVSCITNLLLLFLLARKDSTGTLPVQLLYCLSVPDLFYSFRNSPDAPGSPGSKRYTPQDPEVP